MKAFVRRSLLCPLLPLSAQSKIPLWLLYFVSLTCLGAPPARAAAPTQGVPGPAPPGRSAAGHTDPSLLFDADRGLLAALLADPARVGSTAAPRLTDLAVTPARLDNLIVANVTTTSASASFISDLPSNTVFYTSSPLTEFSNPTLTTDHRESLTGLAPGTGFRLRAMAVTADLGLAALPDAVFTTALPAQPGGAAQIRAGGADAVNDPNDPSAMFVSVSFRNAGSGDASDVTLTSLSAPAGWAFTNPLPLPLDLGALGRGASGIILTRVQPTGAITSPGPPLLTGGGTVTSTGLAPQPFGLGGTVPVLYLAKTANLTSAHQGDAVTFTLSVINRGQGAATGVSLTDTLPAGLTFQNASGGAVPQNGTVAWSAGTLAGGASASVTIGAQVATSAAIGTTITNVGQVFSAEIPNPVASGGASLAVTAPPPPQLQLTKAANQTAVQPGQSIVYTITTANVGAGPATNVQILDPVPAGTTVLGVSPGGAYVDATTIGWNVGTLAPGASTAVTLQVQVAASAAGSSISNVAQIRSAELPNLLPSNQGSPVVVTVQAPAPPPPQLSLAKTVDKSNVGAGGTLTYALTFSNLGSQPFTASLADPLPPGVTFAGSPSGGQFNGSAVQFNLGTLAPGTSGTVSFTAQVNAGAAAGTVIVNQAQLNGPGLSQPVFSNSVSTTVVVPTVPPPVPAGSAFAGTWSSLPVNMPAPATAHASLTVDAQGKFTVWARSQDGQIVAESAQGVLNAAASFDVTSSDGLVHFTGQVAADRQTARITAARTGFVAFTVTASRRADVNALPGALVGTFKGSGAANNGDRLQVRLSIDPGGNATLEAEVLGTTAARQFATLDVSPAGVLISPDGNRQVGVLQGANGALTLTYNYVLTQTGYQNTFPVPLAAGP
jgi:uncharacterized repeat protein (TIGR01451 family)